MTTEIDNSEKLYNIISAVIDGSTQRDAAVALSLVVSDVLAQNEDPAAAYEQFGAVVAMDMERQVGVVAVECA